MAQGYVSGSPYGEGCLMAIGIYTGPFKGIEQSWVFKTGFPEERQLFNGKSSILGATKLKF